MRTILHVLQHAVAIAMVGASMLALDGCSIQLKHIEPARGATLVARTPVAYRFERLEEIYYVGTGDSANVVSISRSDDQAYEVRSYGDSLRQRWSSPLRLATKEYPLMLSQHDAGIALITSRYDVDTVAATLHLFDRTTGRERHSVQLERLYDSLGKTTDGEKRRYGPILASMSPDSSLTLLYWEDNVIDSTFMHYRCLVVDRDYNVVARHLVTRSADVKRAEGTWAPQVDNEGNVYQIARRGIDTLVALRVVVDGKADSLVYVMNRVDVDGDPTVLGSRIVTKIDDKGRVYAFAIAVNEDQENAGLALVGFDFPRRAVGALGYVFPAGLPEKMVDESYFQNLSPHSIHLIDYKTIVLVAEREFVEYDIIRDRASGISYRTSYLVTGDLLVFSIDTDGSLNWQTALRKKQSGTSRRRTSEHSCLVKRVGSTLQILYRDRANLGLMWCSLALRDGLLLDGQRLLRMGDFAYSFTQDAIWKDDGRIVVPTVGENDNEIGLVEIRLSSFAARLRK